MLHATIFMKTIIHDKLNNSTNMKNNDQVAIFESYRDEILAKFKKSLEGESEKENEIENIEEPSSEIEDNDSEIEDIDSEIKDIDANIPDIDYSDIKNDDIEDDEIEIPKKKNVIVRSQELSKDIGFKLRKLVQYMPDLIEDVDVFPAIKTAIMAANSKLPLEYHITDSPLSIYDDLISANVYSEEERDVEDMPDEEVDVLQNFDDDEYGDENDFSSESEFDLSKKTRGEREDFKSAMRRDIERSRAEEILHQMGVDFEDRRGFSDDDY